MQVSKIILGMLFILTPALLNNSGREREQREISKDLFPVQIDGKDGFIDRSGKLVFTMPPHTYNSRWFSHGLLPYAVESESRWKWGFIDMAGKVAIEPQYLNVNPFFEGLAAVELDVSPDKGSIGFIDRTGKLIIYPTPRFFRHRSSIDGLGFFEGLAAIEMVVEKEKRSYRFFGYINKAGEIAIQPIFMQAGRFTEGMARISMEGGYPSRYGYIDKSGKIVIKPQFSHAGEFSEGLAMVQVDVGPEDAKVGYIDKAGNLAIPPRFDDNSTSDLSEVFIYTSSISDRDFSEGLAAVKLNGRWGYIDHTGQTVITPQFVYAGKFKEGLAPVAIKKARKRAYGYIDAKGNMVIPPQFEMALEFRNGLAQVGSIKSNGDFDKRGYIDKMGKYIWTPTK